MFDPVLVYVTFCRGQELDCKRTDLEDPFFLYCWRTGEVIGFPDKCLHERKREVDGQFMCHERWISSIAVCFKADIRLSSLNDAVVRAGEALSDQDPDPSSVGVVV